MILTLGTSPAVARAMVFKKLTLDDVNRAVEVHVSAAGKAVNVARVAAMLGHDSLCTGIIGGETGITVCKNLESLSVKHDFVISQRPTRVCVTVIDQEHNHATELVEESPIADDVNQQDILTRVAAHAQHASSIVCSGTIAKSLSDDLYKNAIQIARKINPNIHAIVDVKGEPLVRAIPCGIIVKCNRQEILATQNTDDLHPAMQKTIDHGAAAIIVSDGPNPTKLTDGKNWWTITSPKINAINPIGSGDSLAAGLACGLEKGLSIAEATRLGIACAIENTQHLTAGFIVKENIDHWLHQLVIST